MPKGTVFLCELCGNCSLTRNKVEKCYVSNCNLPCVKLINTLNVKHVIINCDNKVKEWEDK